MDPRYSPGLQKNLNTQRIHGGGGLTTPSIKDIVYTQEDNSLTWDLKRWQGRCLGATLAQPWWQMLGAALWTKWWTPGALWVLLQEQQISEAPLGPSMMAVDSRNYPELSSALWELLSRVRTAPRYCWAQRSSISGLKQVLQAPLPMSVCEYPHVYRQGQS